MPVLKRKDLNLLCKAENALDQAFAYLGRNHICYVVQDYDTGEEVTETFSRENYWELVSLIEDLLQDKERANRKVAQYHKDHPEKHREYNREWAKNKKAKANK